MTSGDTIVTLPPGHRPDRTLVTAVVGRDLDNKEFRGRVDITPGGLVQWKAKGTGVFPTWISLDNFTFMADR